MIDLLFVWIGLRIGLADALGYDLLVAILVARVLAICALHASRIFEKVAAERTAHDIVEHLHSELVSILLDYIVFLLANGRATIETDIESLLVFCLLDKCQRELDSTYRLQCKPGINEDWSRLWSQARSCRSTSCCRSRAWRALRIGWGLELKVRLRLGTTHFVCRDPSSLIELSLYPLPSDLVNNIRQPYPQKTYGNRMLARLVVDCKLNLVGFVDVKFVGLIRPFVCSRCLRSALERIFNLHDDKSLGSSRESSCGRMVDIGYRMYAYRQMSSERLPLARCVETVVVVRVRRIVHVYV